MAVEKKMDTSLSFRLNERSQRAIHARTGMTVAEIAAADNSALHEKLSRKVGRSLVFDTFNDLEVSLGRGQVYAGQDRLISEKFIERNL